MNYFRRKQNSINLVWIIALAVVLRSFIAPGYMLSTSIEDGLGIVFCDGPVSLNTQQEDHSKHHNHGDDNDEAQQEIYISPICSQWSTSSLLVINTLFVPAFIISTRVKQHTHYQTPLRQQFFDSTRDIRGPPSLS